MAQHVAQNRTSVISKWIARTSEEMHSMGSLLCCQLERPLICFVALLAYNSGALEQPMRQSDCSSPENARSKRRSNEVRFGARWPGR